MVKHNLGSGAVHRPGVMLQVHDVQLAVTTHTHTHTQGSTSSAVFVASLQQTVTYMVAMAMSLSDRLSLAGLGTTGSSISNFDILVMVPFWK